VALARSSIEWISIAPFGEATRSGNVVVGEQLIHKNSNSTPCHPAKVAQFSTVIDIQECLNIFSSANVRGEIVVGDNGSTDGSQEISRSLGARAVSVPLRGYGSALLAGIRACNAEHIVMGDSERKLTISLANQHRTSSIRERLRRTGTIKHKSTSTRKYNKGESPQKINTNPIRIVF